MDDVAFSWQARRCAKTMVEFLFPRPGMLCGVFSVCEANGLLLASQLGMAWGSYGVKPRITPVNTRGVQELLGEDAKYKSIPVNYKNPVSSYIDRVLLTTDAEGMKVYKIITRQTRRPEVGHSAAARK